MHILHDMVVYKKLLATYHSIITSIGLVKAIIFNVCTCKLSLIKYQSVILV